ncbi:MAG TPA: histidine phosphatase family protein [Candidatus Binataceae bacterium]|nr:histidine phosphatase family protein [Candidatus Binataceae bacterium]
MSTTHNNAPHHPPRRGRFIMVRHGESEGNRDRRFTITTETPLTELGREQARNAGRRIARLFKPEIIVSSPFARARQTSDLINEHLGLPIEIVHDLHERDLGCLKGQSYDSLRELVRTDPTYDPADGWSWKPEGGESYEDVRQRVIVAIEDLRQRYAGREIVIVSHGGVMLSVWAHIVGAWHGAHLPPNCGIVLVEHDATRLHSPQIIVGAEEGELG